MRVKYGGWGGVGVVADCISRANLCCLMRLFNLAIKWKQIHLSENDSYSKPSSSDQISSVKFTRV